MKKLSAVLAIVVTCAALLMLASHTEAITPAAAKQLELALLPTSTATPLPTVAPDTFSMTGAITYHAPNELFSIKIPKSWQPQTPVGTKFFSFIAGSITAPQASLVIQFTDKVELSTGLGLDSTAASPREILQKLKAQVFPTTSGTISQIYVAHVGNLTGVGLTITTKDKPVQAVDLRIAELNKDQLIVMFFSTYQQYWPKAKPVLDKVLASLVVKPQNLPTITPTFTATPITPTPTVVIKPSAFSDIHQTVIEDGSPLVGDPSASVTILEFVDFSCPHCREYQPVMRQVIDKYVRGGDARIIVRFLRFVGGSYSELSAAAALCAANQAHFLDMEEALFAVEEQQSYEAYTPETIRDVASKLNLDVDKLMSCVEDPATLATVDKDESMASNLGVQGVPSVFYSIDGTHFKGIPDGAGEFSTMPSFEDLAKAIEGAFDAGKSKL